MNKKKRGDLSVKQKDEILKQYDKLPKMSQRCAAQHLNISQPLLCKLLKNRVKIENSFKENKPSNRKRNRAGKDPDVDDALVSWFKNVRQHDVTVDGNSLKQKAEDLARNLGKENFTATDGWLSRWKKREGILNRKLQGEQNDAQIPAAEIWMKYEWPKIIAEYSPENIYNASETGLYFRALPNQKICKERITILCCVNMIGEKCPLFVIGKSQKPRCFENVLHLPVDYSANKNAWMTASFFTEWLKKWDSKLTKKIVLLVDNCPAHKVDFTLNYIKLVFLPTNPKSLIQPCDQGIIKTFKCFYRSEMRQRVLNLMDGSGQSLNDNVLANKISLLDALHLVACSWKRVTRSTVQNCFKNAGFIVKEIQSHEDLNVQEYNQWMAIDENVCTHAPITDSDDCEEISLLNEIVEVDNDENETDVIVIPSKLEIFKALDVIRRSIQSCGKDFEKFYEFEQYLSEINQQKLTQLTDPLNIS